MTFKIVGAYLDVHCTKTLFTYTLYHFYYAFILIHVLTAEGKADWKHTFMPLSVYQNLA